MKKYQIELAETEDFEIEIAKDEKEIFDIAVEKYGFGGFLNIFEINDDYEIVKTVV